MPWCKCALCGNQAEILPYQAYAGPERSIRGFLCRTCGQYSLSVQAEKSFLTGTSLGANASERVQLSWVTRERHEEGSPITVLLGTPDATTGEANAASISQILDTRIPRSDQERVDRALRNLHRKAPGFGQSVALDPATDYPLLFADDPGAAQFMLNQLVGDGLLQQSISYAQGGGEYTLTLAGRSRVSELYRTGDRGEPPFGQGATASTNSLSTDQRLLRALNELGPHLGASYSQILADLKDDRRRTTKDCANGIRELLREVVDLLTPDKDKSGQRRDKVRAIFVARGAGTRIAESAEQSIALIEQKAELFVKSYDRANADSHTASDRRELEGLWRLADYLLHELLPD